MRRWLVGCITLVLLVSLAVFGVHTRVNAQEETITPLWQAGSSIHDSLFNAQQALFNADSAKAAAEVETASQLYEDVIALGLQASAPDAASIVGEAFADAEAAAAAGDASTYAYASGVIWTNLLRGSYEATLNALQAGDGAAASEWLRLREYRQATKFSLVDDPAAQAIFRLQGGGSNLDEVITTVSNDLRAAYTFRLRDALTKLEDAAANNYTVRSADWAARIGGYFGILQADFSAKRGEAETAALQQQIKDLQAAAQQGDLATVAVLDDVIKTALANYEPVELTAEEIGRRAQLLYLFIDLTQVEYGRGVQGGQITIPIEVQEAVTFRNQAVALSEELRPIMNANDPEAADALATTLDQIKVLMTAVGSPADLRALIDQALTHAKTALKIEANLTDVSASFTIIDSMLKDMKTAVLGGDYELAERKRLEAYAILDAGIEQRLRGFAPEQAAEVENLFWQGTSEQPGLSVLLANYASITEFEDGLAALNAALAEGQQALNVANSAPEAVVGNAAIIVFREGLEAVLILASLLAGMRTVESRKYRRSLAAGAGLAMLGAVITWLIFSSILGFLLPLGERLEAVISLIAIVVLLVITNWFFHKTYWVGWMANFHSQKSKILGGAAIVGPSLGLLILGFTSVYREVFETVLFLQSLVLDAGANVVLEGVAIGLVGTAVVGFLTFRLQMRLPYKQMLVVTGVLIGFVLVTMVGNTVHVFQVVGWLPITPISGVYLPYWLGRWFGVFATWQGIILQIASAVFVVGSYFLAEHLNQRKREQAAARRTATIQAVAVKSES